MNEWYNKGKCNRVVRISLRNCLHTVLEFVGANMTNKEGDSVQSEPTTYRKTELCLRERRQVKVGT